MNTTEKTDHVLALAREGRLGTPGRPNRGSSARCIFWDCYNGLRRPADWRGTLSFPYAKAGQLLRKEHAITRLAVVDAELRRARKHGSSEAKALWEERERLHIAIFGQRKKSSRGSRAGERQARMNRDRKT